jgi:hypothetical protein
VVAVSFNFLFFKGLLVTAHRCSVVRSPEGEDIDAHRGSEGGGIKVYPPSKILAKLVNKKCNKAPKRCTLPPKFSQPLYTIPAKIW